MNTSIVPIAQPSSRASSHAIAMGMWLAEHRWDHTVVVTSGEPRGPESFARQFERRIVNPLGRKLGRPLAYFWAVEGDGGNTHHHLHALIEGTSSLPISQIRALWPFGTTSVSRYASTDAAWYVSKGILEVRDNYDISRTPPRPLQGRGEMSEEAFRQLVMGRLSSRDTH